MTQVTEQQATPEERASSPERAPLADVPRRHSTDGPGPRLRVLRERNVRLFFTGYTTSLVGASMVPVALTFAVLNEGYGTAEVGYVLAAETLPLVALLLLGGLIADRFPRRASMLGADVVRFVSEGVLAGLLLTGSPPLWALMAPGRSRYC
ncbi:MAG: hypothetical protein ACYCU0_00900 [Solirubrobacteraceae bacterium]